MKRQKHRKFCATSGRSFNLHYHKQKVALFSSFKYSSFESLEKSNLSVLIATHSSYSSFNNKLLYIFCEHMHYLLFSLIWVELKIS